MPASTLAAYSSTPAVTLGESTPDGLGEFLLGVLVEEDVDGMARCEIRLHAWGVKDDSPGYLWFDRDTIDFGTELTVSMGPADESSSVFTGRVSAIECSYAAAGSTIVVLAEDRLQDLRMTRRTRSYADVTDGDVIERIARDHGLTADVQIAGPMHRQLCQLNQSDLAFVRHRARPLGADVWLEGSTLHVARPEASDPVVLRHGRELLDLRVLADLAHQCTEQRVCGWDVATKEPVEESAGASAGTAELGQTLLGPSGLLKDAFGDRVTTSVLAAATSAAEARALATGLYLDRARRFVTGHGTCDGIPSLRCGRSVDLSGLGRLFDGRYELSPASAHRFDREQGYRTEIAVQRPGIGT